MAPSLLRLVQCRQCWNKGERGGAVTRRRQEGGQPGARHEQVELQSNTQQVGEGKRWPGAKEKGKASENSRQIKPEKTQTNKAHKTNQKRGGKKQHSEEAKKGGSREKRGEEEGEGRCNGEAGRPRSRRVLP